MVAAMDVASASAGGGPPQISTSGHRSAPFPQTTVPASIRTSRNNAGSLRRASKIGPRISPDTSRSMTASFVSRSRKRKPSRGVTSRIRIRVMIARPHSRGGMSLGATPARAIWRLAHPTEENNHGSASQARKYESPSWGLRVFRFAARIYGPSLYVLGTLAVKNFGLWRVAYVRLPTAAPRPRAPREQSGGLAEDQPRDWSYEPLFDLPVRRTQTGDLPVPDPVIV